VGRVEEALRAGKTAVDAALLAALDRRFDAPDREASPLYRAMRDALAAGGKRLRPVLLLRSAELVGGRAADALYAAAALEFIHTYSLIHDDLPAMDDADLRRGRPTMHKVYGEGLAVLAGDALLTEAFALLAEGTPAISDERARRAALTIAGGAGVRGMVRGQELDLLHERRVATHEAARAIHRHKTAAMFEAAAQAGAILGGGTESQVAALAEYGLNLGLAFQIRDDLLDVEGRTADTGKPTGLDAAEGKCSYPAAVGVEASRAEIARLIDAAVAALAGFGAAAWFFVGMAKLIGERTA